VADHRRERQIAEILLRHGMEYLVGVLGLDRWVSLERRVLGHGPAAGLPTRAEDLRLALEELGPTFIKLAQVLSTRADLLPQDYQDELAKLQDTGPRIAPEVVKATIDRELHNSASAAFASFDPEPLAEASIGQAHAATLQDGTEVVVKIRRPGVVETIEQDLEIVRNLAARASRSWAAATRYDVVGLAEEFADALRAQLDYLREGRNADRFAANFAGDHDVQIPRVFWELTTSRVITLERLRGMKINDVAALDAAGVDRHALAERSAGVTAKMVFEDGFFHADPHPGNFFVQSTGRIGLIDFGLVGVLDDRMRDRLGKLLAAFVRERPGQLADALLALGTSAGPVDRARLSRDLDELLESYVGRGLGEIALSRVLGDVFGIVRRHRLRVPPDLALLVGTLAISEGVMAQVDPQFQYSEALAPYARRQLLAQLSPAAVGRRLEQIALDFEELAVDFPGQLHRVLDVLASGGLEVHVRAAELEPLLTRAERLGNRIAGSVLLAAVIDGLAELAAADRARGRGWPARKVPKVPTVLAAVATAGGYSAFRRTARRRRRPSNER
jgi:ubiquinone biosynthesis protein